MIEIKNLCKSFGDHVIFEDFNLTIEDGEFVVFAGASGCGKTTLLNMLGGLEEPDDGQITMDGIELYGRGWRKQKREFFSTKVGFLFQNFALLENQSVRANLNLLPRRCKSMVSLTQALEAVGLVGKEDTMVYKLSGGEQQRVALARLMIKKCDIILADEPTGSLDGGNAEAVMEILHKLNEQGKTVILVTHNEKIIEEEKRVVLLS